MTSTLVPIFIAFLLGLPIARSLDRGADPLQLAGTAFLYGTGTIFLVLLAFSVLGIPWSAPIVGAVLLVIFAVRALFEVRRMRGRRSRAPRPHIVDLLTLATVAGYAFYATAAAPWEVDFWAIWGLKARVFLESGGIDWRFLASGWNVFQHSDYPLLVPFNLDFGALVTGEWDDRWMGAWFVAWGASLIAVVRSLAAREATPFFASLITVAVAASCLTRFVGLAEGPLVAFGTAAVLFLRMGLRDDDEAPWRHGALLLGLAANCKNEGLALLAAATLAVAISGPRRGIVTRVKRLWPAFALAAPWLVIRALHALPTDLVSGSVLDRAMEHLSNGAAILGVLAARLAQPWAWIALAVALLAIPAATLARERFVLAVTAIQLLFFVGAYFTSPFDVAWHVWASWPRLTAQLAAPISFVVVAMLVRVLSEPPGIPLRESRA
ncbi:MAG TPA: hypothetical protein VGI57_00690 [Usitatibacter sp.]